MMMDIKKIQAELMQELEGGPVHREARGGGDIPSMLEHSLLVPDLTLAKLEEDCTMARKLRIGAVCVPPQWVGEAKELLRGSTVKTASAVGIPSPLMSTKAKVADVRNCVMLGAEEIDIAVDVAAVKSGLLEKAEKDFFAAVDCAAGRAEVKASFEHGAYSDDEKAWVLQMIKRSGAKYVKIQNLLSGHGARVEDIRYVKSQLGNKIKIKIDGGVKTLAQAKKLIAAGADRIGLTATKAVAQEAKGSID